MSGTPAPDRFRWRYQVSISCDGASRLREGVMNRPVLIIAILALTPGVACADPVADFYRGKNLNLLIGSGVGGGVDQVARVVARHLGRHVPGNPTVVPRNMGGSGGLTVLNHIQTVAPKDGATIGVVLPSLVFDPLFTGKTTDHGYD